MNRTWIRQSVFALLSLLASAGQLAAAEYPDPERYRKVIDAFAAEPQPEAGGIVATGSSSMRGWHRRIDADLAPLKIIKRGFGGSNMYDVRYFLSELVLRHKPRAVLLYEGDNDAALGASPEQVMEHFEEIVEGIHTHLPDTRVYVLAVKPSLSRWRIWPAMSRTNDMLKTRCEEDVRLRFVDVATPMLGADGKPPEELFIGDMLHMTEAGYDVWRDATRAIVLPAESPAADSR
ncbi:MAG: hypothetical protein CMQ29_10475 [Gammaproteobacteria bacterium]|jgi:lysophospholipase L1-like esterase|nr:hypothetical protein [Gammaproteobacteria bacterium]|tara:strand:+ start:26 stop:727 length:702 start_codon:yes stop_codon:yes gene_type:complete